MGYRSKQRILNRGILNGWETLKCSTFSVISEMQTKSALRVHFTPVRIPRINNTSDSSCWQGRRIRGTLIHCWWGADSYSHYGNECGGSSERWELIYLTIQLYHPWDTSSYHKNTCSTMFITALLITPRNWKTYSRHEWIIKIGTFTQKNISQPLKKN